MRRSPSRLGPPLACAAVGASILAIPASATAVASPADQSGPSASSGSSTGIKTRVTRRRIEYGRPVVVLGNAPSSDHGLTVALQYRSGNSGWRQVASAPVSADGSFRLAAPLNRSGWLMTTITPVGATAAAHGAVATSSSASSSTPVHVAVAAVARVHPRAINEFGARSIVVRGTLLPNTPGRRVLLQGFESGRWVTLSSGRTSSRGAFRLRYRPAGLGEHRLRVRFKGDATNAAVSSAAGRVTVYEPTVASWYYDAGTTGCGFHANYGVANLSLPCGTKVRFFYRGRTVDAVVDDRGPYVGGRTWDLNQNTAAALGFAGVDTVWSSR